MLPALVSDSSDIEAAGLAGGWSSLIAGSPVRLRACHRTTATAQAACAVTCWLTDPRSMPAKPPRPRVPTTSRSAFFDGSISVLAGELDV
jgi:hypothetical protein